MLIASSLGQARQISMASWNWNCDDDEERTSTKSSHLQASLYVILHCQIDDGLVVDQVNDVRMVFVIDFLSLSNCLWGSFECRAVFRGFVEEPSWSINAALRLLSDITHGGSYQRYLLWGPWLSIMESYNAAKMFDRSSFYNTYSGGYRISWSRTICDVSCASELILLSEMKCGTTGRQNMR